MTEQDWTEWFAKSFAVFLNGQMLRSRDELGRRLRDDSFLLLFNGHVDAVPFTLPDAARGGRWSPVIDTAAADPFAAAAAMVAGETIDREGLSLLVLRRT
jgi:glycogen operon protein